MSKAEQAVACFLDGLMCSQAVLSIYGEEYGLDNQTALRIAETFGGGMGSMGHTCGAVTGAYMVIGLKHGRTKTRDKQAEAKSQEMVREFAKEFTARNGTLVCRELLDTDISTPEGVKHAWDSGLFTTVCPGFVRDASEIIEQILSD
jgi:C_GCAxxG_C_C family probable redox protein